MKYNKGDEEAKTIKKMGTAINAPMEKMKPHLHVSAEDLPAIKKWQVGKSYKVMAKIKQTSMSEDDMGTHAGFEVESVKPEA